jgi:diaminohydroxyphosphoribosylaminopyrimidine deaminase/5-amino-6-(5-phosphoribosylamino)uracil reductase
MDAEQAMRRALELAQKGLGSVEPNPAVGCVLLKDGRLIGEGWHRKFGGPHAEIEALNDCRQRGNDPRGAVVYVTLEPCCFTGKTGPCTQALIQAGVSEVIAAMEDPFPKVCGKGLKELQQAGIPTQVGLCRQEAEALNAPYLKHLRTGRPWVILKWAQSLDGKLGRRVPSKDTRWISNEACRRHVHQIRKKVQGILTGIQTILEDNPQLTVRLEEPVSRPPVRMVLDSQLRIPWDCRVLTTQEAPTWVFTTPASFQIEPEKVFRLRQAGVEVLAAGQKEQRCDLEEVLDQAGSRGLQQILVEAGPTLLTEFLKRHLADEVFVYIAPVFLGQSGIADLSAAMSCLGPIELSSCRIQTFGENVLISGRISS